MDVHKLRPVTYKGSAVMLKISQIKSMLEFLKLFAPCKFGLGCGMVFFLCLYGFQTLSCWQHTAEVSEEVSYM